MRLSRSLVLVSVSLVLGVVLYCLQPWEHQGDATHPVGVDGGGTTKTHEEIETSTKDPNEPAATGVAEGSQGSRKALESGAVMARVLDENGQGLFGVEVDWRLDQGLPPGWQPLWERAATLIRDEDRLARSWSEEDGRYGAPSAAPKSWNAAPDQAHPVVAWFFEPGWLATGFSILAGTPLENWARDVHLEAHAPVVVRVHDAKGGLVEGAEVLLGGCADPLHADPLHADPLHAEERNALAPLLPLALQRKTTDAEGSVVFAALPGRIRVEAHLGQLLAMPYAGPNRETIDLTLQEGFSVAGKLTVPSELDHSVAPRLRAAVRRSGTWQNLLTVAVQTDVEWGPFELPLLEGAEEYSLEFEAPPLQMIRRYFPPPATGEELYFPLEGSLGERIAILPVEAGTENDQIAKRILGGRVLVSAMDGGRWIKSWYAAREDGLIEISGLRPGLIWYELFAPEYAPAARTSLSVPIDGENAWREPLERSGRLRGRVIEEDGNAGAPIEDFEVVLWPAGVPLRRSTFAFRGRTDGSFEIDTVPTGEFAVTAATDSRPAPLPTMMTLAAGESTEIELVVPAGNPVRGRVLSEGKQEPITNARIQSFVQGGAAPILPWGAPRSVDAQGRFAFPGGVPRENFFNIEAEGYSSKYLSASPDKDGVIDVGDVFLSQPGQLTVRLLGLDTRLDLDPGQLSLRLEGATRQVLKVKQLEDGSWGSQFDAVNSGFLYVDLYAGETYLAESSISIAPAEICTLDFQLGGGSTLDVTLKGGTPEQREKIVWLLVESQTEHGQDYLYERIMQGKEAETVRGVQGTRAALNLLAGDGTTRLGATVVDLKPNENLPVVIDLDARRFTVTVVDRDGQPLSGAYVSIGSVDGGEALFGRKTGNEGTCEFLGVPKTQVLIGLQHSSAGRRTGVEIDGRQDEVTLTLDGSGRLEVFVRDEGQPVAGADVSLFDTGGNVLVLHPTGADGLASFKNWAPSHAKLAIGGKGLWDYAAPIEIGEGVTRLEPGVWHTGVLELHVTSEQARDLAGASLQLKHMSSGESLATWVEEGRVAASCLHSDAHGKIQFAAIPHGTYRLQLDSPGLQGIETLIEVRAAETVSQTFTLQPKDD